MILINIPDRILAMKYEKKFNVTIEVWVTHRSEMGIKHISDPENKEWKASVRHSNKSMEWQWCKTFEEAVAWCESFKNA